MRTATFDTTPQPVHARPVPGVADVLAAYFAGDVDALDAIPVEPVGGTPSSATCGSGCARSRPGRRCRTASSRERVGEPRRQRAVGMANASNPIALIVPCHRVIRTGGALGGYGFGLEYKRWLLDHESARERL